jgi:hypothetical protein
VKGLERPVVIQSGWARLGETELPANVHVAGSVRAIEALVGAQPQHGVALNPGT